MDDLRRRFASLDQVPTPDLWDAIERRAAAAAPTARVTAVVTPVPMPSRRSTGRSLTVLLAATALLGALVAGAIAVGSGRVKPPAFVPVDPSPSPSVQASPSASHTVQVGTVAYRHSNRVWVVYDDGTGARELLPFEPIPGLADYQNSPDHQYPVAWSPDGSRLYYRFERTEYAGPDDSMGVRHSGLAVTNAAGSELEEWDLSTVWCPVTVEADNCQANVEDVAVSPDGTRLAYVILEGRDLERSAIVILNLASRQVARLDSTRTQNPGSGLEEPCTSDASQGDNELPSWSPDGTRLVFARQSIGPRVSGFCQSTIFTVNVDGNDLRRLVPPDVPALSPRWSPDGSSIIFHAAWPLGSTGVIYSVRADGTGLRALTSDGVSVWPHWTRDGRIVFIRGITPDGRGDLWIMDGAGGNATPLDATVPALTAAGCLACPYPDDQGRYWAVNHLNERLWQPVPASQP